VKGNFNCKMAFRAIAKSGTASGYFVSIAIAIMVVASVIAVLYFSSGLVSSNPFSQKSSMAEVTTNTSATTYSSTSNQGDSSTSFNSQTLSSSLKVITSGTQSSLTSASSSSFATSFSSSPSSISSEETTITTTSTESSTQSISSTSTTTESSSSSSSSSSVKFAAFNANQTMAAGGAAFNPETNLVYAAYIGTVNVINGVSLDGSDSQTLGYPNLVTVDTSNGQVFAIGSVGESSSCSTEGITQIQGTNTLSQTLVDGVSGGIVYDPQNGYLYAGVGGAGSSGACENGILVFEQPSNPSSDQQFVPIGPQETELPGSPNTPVALAYDSTSGNVYIATYPWYDPPGQTETTIYEASGLSILSKTMTISGETANLVYDPANNYLYAVQELQSGAELIVINTLTDAQVGSISLSNVAPLAYDSAGNVMYIFQQSTILEISETQIVRTYAENMTGGNPVLACVYIETTNQIDLFY
jgi:hypothetical protein